MRDAHTLGWGKKGEGLGYLVSRDVSITGMVTSYPPLTYLPVSLVVLHITGICSLCGQDTQPLAKSDINMCNRRVPIRVRFSFARGSTQFSFELLNKIHTKPIGTTVKVTPCCKFHDGLYILTQHPLTNAVAQRHKGAALQICFPTSVFAIFFLLL